MPLNELTDAERSQIAELQQSEDRRLFHETLRKALVQLRESLGVSDPVYVAGEKLYQLDGDAKLQIVDNPEPRPYAWAIGHDVRPARWALGANGCTDCHAEDSPFLYANVISEAPVPAEDLKLRSMHDYAEIDETLWSCWNKSLRAKPLLVYALAGTLLGLVGVIFLRGATWASVRSMTRSKD